MRLICSLLVMSFVMWLTSACAPKISQNTNPATEQPTANPVRTTGQTERLSPCATFDNAPSKEDATTQYVLYRDFLKEGDWTQAFEYWKQVFAVAPAADGKRNTLFADGIRFYEYFYAQTQDSLQREVYIDRIFDLYHGLDSCFRDGGYATGRKAFDLYYKYPHRASHEEVFSMFETAVMQDNNLMRDFIINPFAALLIELYEAGKISMAAAQKYDVIIRTSLAKGLADCEGSGCDRWSVVEEYAPQRLEYFETVKGFYDCSYYKAKYYKEFESAPDDCDVIRNVYSYLRWGGCADDDPQVLAVVRRGNELCVERERGPASLAYECLRNADYRCAIDGFILAANQSTDIEQRANYLMTAGKIYYAHLKNFSKARQTFLQAAETRPNWGEPYLWIGRLYASSGPLCGPGRGWDSQIVVWPAIDKWEYAKRIDPSCTREANKWISQYEQYMPDRSEIFSRLLKEGDTFLVGCWIQERTTVRAVKTQ